MHVHRIQVAVTIGWLFLLFNIERIYEPINLASFVYALAALGGMLMLLFRPLRDAALYRPIGIALASHIIVKCLLGYAISIENLLLTFSEAIAIAVTMGLAAMIGRNTDRFTKATHDLALMHRPDSVPSLEEAEPAFDREIRRARRHSRPLSLVTLRPLPESLLQARPAFAVRLERELVGRYVFGLIAQALLEGTKSHDLIARSADGFTLLLPETNREQAEQMAARLSSLCSVVLGIEAHTIVAGFPDDELTMSGLLARAGSSPDAQQSRPRQQTDPPETAVLQSV